jgi:hypothetical protein
VFTSQYDPQAFIILDQCLSVQSHFLVQVAVMLMQCTMHLLKTNKDTSTTCFPGMQESTEAMKHFLHRE